MEVTHAAPHHLVADAVRRDGSPAPYALRRTRAGDAWDRRRAGSCAVPAPGAGSAGAPVVLGLPGVRVGA